MMTDTAVLGETRQAAAKLLKDNPALEGESYRGLREKINEMFSRVMN